MMVFVSGVATLGFLALWFVQITAVQVLEDVAGDVSWPQWTYTSAPDFHPPRLDITRPEVASDGYLFFSTGGPEAEQVSPLIMESNGDLIWNGPLNFTSFNFGVQQYKGEKVLLAWNGTRFPEPVGRGHGEVYLYNKHYEKIKTITLEGNFVELNKSQTFKSSIDLHEHYITPQDTLLVLAYNVTQTDLTSVGGPKDGWVSEGQVYEIDIETNEVLFSWKSLDHLDQLPFTDSVYPLGSEEQDGKTQEHAWGYFHHNSVTPFHDGYIISSRYLCAGIAIGRDGKVLWVLQGRDGGDFELEGGNSTTNFCYQHDIRVLREEVGSDGKASHLTIAMHDNANCPIDKNEIPTAGKVFDLDMTSMKVSETHRYLNQSALIYATAQGSHQRMENDNVFEGHGYVPVMEEFAPDGTPLSRWQFGKGIRTDAGGYLSPAPEDVVLSYRAYKQTWTGCPKTKPSVVLQPIGPAEAPSGTKIFISWNGATEVRAWEIWGGIETMSYITTVKKEGFETVAEIEDVSAAYVKPVLRRGAPRGCGQGVRSETTFITG